MKVVIFNRSPKAEVNTYDCLNIVMDELKSEGIEGIAITILSNLL